METLNNRKLKTSTLILQYSLIFAIVTAGVFCVLAVFGKSFMEYNDGYKQGYFLTNELKQFLGSLISGNGYPLWSWYKGLGMPTDLTADPLNILAALFPARYTELGFSIAAAFRLYFGGLAFLIFIREMRLSDFQCICGSVLYIYSSWFINTTLIQNSFVVGAYMLPILILAVDYIYRDRSPALFICAVAYYLMRDSYAAYMAAIVTIMYLLLRYFYYNREFKLSEYLKQIGFFICYGLSGILISSLFLLQTVFSILNASTESGKTGVDLFYTPDFYLGLGKGFISTGVTSGYTFLGLPILALLVLPVAFRKFSFRNTSCLMTAVLLIMMLFPFFSSMFNGFSYSSGRWYFAIIFFASWAATEVLDIEYLQQKKNLLLMSVGLLLLIIWTIGFQIIGLIGMSLRSLAFVLMNLAAGAVLIFIIAICKDRFSSLVRRRAILLVSCLTIICCWSLNFYVNIDSFISNGEVDRQLKASTQRVSSKISNEGFYRTDQVDWINLHKDMDMPANENLYWQAKSIYQYDSMLSSRQLEFNRLLGNNYGYLMRVYTISNDNRMGLDFLYGVKYFLGDDTANGVVGSDEYAGYGFEFMDNIDGVNVFENRYDSGLGFAYNSYIREKEFRKLSIPEREQALLQAVVVPDDVELSSDISKVNAEDIRTDVTASEYEIVSTDGLSISDNEITVEKPSASMTMKVSGTADSQLLVSFENLVNEKCSSFSLRCTDGKISETAKRKDTNQSISDVRDFTMNMGYVTDESVTLNLSFSTVGTYSFDSFNLYAMDVANYDQFAAERLASRYNIDSYDSKHVCGTVDMGEDGILYLSIPQYANWDVFVDGKQAQTLEDVNIAFLGVEVPEGHHSVTLEYHNPLMLWGLILSLLGIAVSIGICLLHRRSSKRKASLEKKQQTY